MSSESLRPTSLAEAEQLRPSFEDVPIKPFVFRVRRLPLADKLKALRLIADAQNDEGVIEDDEQAMGVWVRVLAIAIVNAENEPEYNCAAGINFLAGLPIEQLTALQDAVVRINGLNAAARESELSQAKND